MLRFQELDSDNENNGLQVDLGLPQVSSGKNLNPDELYFNDMDIRAWERRTSAEQEPNYQAGDELYYDDHGELMSVDDYEEILFRRVLDKIRIARAAGHADVDLTSDEIDAYQAKMHGVRSPSLRPDLSQRQSDHDNASAASIPSASKHKKPSSRSKKDQPKISLFGTKSKKDKEKEKTSSRKRTPTIPSPSHNAPPGFVIPGPDGQPVFTPVNAYEGSLSYDRRSIAQLDIPVSVPAASSHRDPTPPLTSPSREILGAFPGSEDAYETRAPAKKKKSSRRYIGEQDDVDPAHLVPFPVEPYQYHSFSPSSASPTSPPPYIRNVSATPSEASYVSMPRRMPVSPSASVPTVVQRTSSDTATQPPPDPVLPTQTYAHVYSTSAEDPQDITRRTSTSKEAEKKKKVSRSRKKE